jgi:hypothetical protein
VTVTGSTKKSSQTLAVVRTAAVGGSQWRSDLALANPSDDPLDVEFLYQPTGSAEVSERTISLASRERFLLGDLVATFLAPATVAAACGSPPTPATRRRCSAGPTRRPPRATLARACRCYR